MEGAARWDAPPPITVQTSYFNGFGFAMAVYDNARWQISKHQYAAGVLLAQDAVEMGAWGPFTSLLVRRDGEIDDKTYRERVPDLSFMEKGTRRLWTEFTGGHRVTHPKDPPVWKHYVAHVEYRNLIAPGQTWGDTHAPGRRDQPRSLRGATALPTDDEARAAS